jgi:hypothetical protein
LANFGKQLAIAAIKVDSTLITSDMDKTFALAAAWSPTFSHVSRIDSDLAEMVARRFTSKFDFQDFGPPSSRFFKFYLQTVRNSAPGIDGIPYRAWLVAGPPAHLLLHQVSAWLCSGLDMLIGFNDTLQIFAAKGTEERDDIEVIREPSSTRPLGLKNSDVKAISGATYYLNKTHITKRASRLQNGFIHSRNFLITSST